MKAFKRIAATVLLLAMVFSLVACGEKPNNNTGGDGEYDFDGQTITIYCDENTGGSDGDNIYFGPGAVGNITISKNNITLYGMNAFCFDKKKFGYGPEKQRGAVRIVVYSNEIINKEADIKQLETSLKNKREAIKTEVKNVKSQK